MHQVNHIGANRSEWHEPDLRRSIDFHAVLLAMAGHDLRQHLQIILNSYGWPSARATSDPERERIARGQNAVMQMAEQLHQLVTALRINQKTSGMALVPVRLGSLFSTLGQDATKFAAERGVQLRVVPTRAVVASDPVLLGSIIGNLARNAVKFTPSGGQVLLGCRRFGSMVRIEVHDTGIGISPGRLQNIFEAFHRLEPTRSDGLGLGLRREPRGRASSASNRGALYGWSRFLLHGPCECFGSRLAVTGGDHKQNCRGDPGAGARL